MVRSSWWLERWLHQKQGQNGRQNIKQNHWERVEFCHWSLLMWLVTWAGWVTPCRCSATMRVLGFSPPFWMSTSQRGPGGGVDLLWWYTLRTWYCLRCFWICGHTKWLFRYLFYAFWANPIIDGISFCWPFNKADLQRSTFARARLESHWVTRRWLILCCFRRLMWI